VNLKRRIAAGILMLGISQFAAIPISIGLLLFKHGAFEFWSLISSIMFLFGFLIGDT
jgi:hypothetical protein